MSEWKKVKLGELCKNVTSGGTPKSSIASYYYPSTIPWLKTKEVNYNRIYETENHISDEGLRNSSAKLIPSNSIIVAMYGQGDTAGRVAINKIPVTTNQACCNLTIDENKADYEFVYYNLCTLYDKLVSLKNGGAQPNLNAGIIKNLEISIPSLPTQHRIATILSRYDSLIENYQKQIKLLEEAALRLYKEWFIDLHFPGHENSNIIDGVPEGWEKKKVGEMLIMHIGGGWGKDCPDGVYDVGGYVIRGTDISQIEIGNMNIPYRYHTESNLKERRLKEGDIIFEVSGGSAKEPVGRTLFVTEELVSYFGQNTICASFCKKMSFKSIQESIISYHTIRYFRKIGYLHKYEKDSAGKIINYNWNDFLNEFEILIPESKMLDNISKRFNNIIAETSKKKSQLRLLTEARDRLLPKLMSGEIEI